MKRIGTDTTGTTYFVSEESELSAAIETMPAAHFAVTLFIGDGATIEEIGSSLRLILRRRPSWVFTTGPRAEYWHDVIDELAVAMQIQKTVGDGDPMTAWFSEVASAREWRTSHDFSGDEHHLFVFIGRSDTTDSVSVLQAHIEEPIQPPEPMRAKGPHGSS